jgi:quercetin dioxygenase-like cupin family protein
MQIPTFPFQILDWQRLETSVLPGETGHVFSQTFMMGDIRVRKVSYSPGYKADHWCSKGHVIHCLSGAMDTELEDGRVMHLTAGMTYIVGDANDAHRSSSKDGCTLFIVD